MPSTLLQVNREDSTPLGWFNARKTYRTEQDVILPINIYTSLPWLPLVDVIRKNLCRNFPSC